ncbi:MAG: DUF1361 domain-containing protein [Armatimonadota bacterium]
MKQSISWFFWNIFLAMIPVVIAYTIGFLPKITRFNHILSRFLFIVLGVIWLIFMPNTCYLLTEWRHFLEMMGYSDLYARSTYNSDARLMLMALIMFYMCYSWIGILSFTLAIKPILHIVKKRCVRVWILAIPFFILMSIGVYLGLVHRFNSWNFLNESGSIFAILRQLVQRPTLLLYVTFFAGFLWIIYISTDIWIEGFVRRFGKLRSSNEE